MLYNFTTTTLKAYLSAWSSSSIPTMTSNTHNNYKFPKRHANTAKRKGSTLFTALHSRLRHTAYNSHFDPTLI